ncbi:MAG: aspartate kinase [Candidatus Sabulitectum sp.]|nr:aspartate kinase [Candidatus Sabulitectum sp.]
MRKKLLVAKFGGTSLATEENRCAAANHCSSLLQEAEKLVVVVSAMGRSGDPYATDTLLDLISTESSVREKDRLMICGEVVSALVMASALRNNGISAEALTGWEAGISTDGVSGNARIVSIDTARIQESLSKYNVVVISGFQGVAPMGHLNTLGRGGTDTSAVVLGVALDADEVLLYKTVDSVYTADPEKVPFARELDIISAEDLRQMAWHGAKVVHPRAAEVAQASALTLKIKSFRTGEMVTEVAAEPLENTRYIVGVASGQVVTGFTVTGSGKPSFFFAGLFRKIADSGISMDMFSVFNCSAAFTVPVDSTGELKKLLDSMDLQYTTISPCVKVSIVGAGMHGLPGVMARFCEALERVDINALQTVDSHATISALVLLDQRDSALQELHREFIE